MIFGEMSLKFLEKGGKTGEKSVFWLRMCGEYGILYGILKRGKIPRYGRGFSLENQNEKDYMEIDLVEVFYILKKNLRNIFVVTLCCVLIAAGYVFLLPKAAATYTSEALVRVRMMPIIMRGNQSPVGTKSDLKAVGADSYEFITPMGYGMLNLNQRFLTYGELLKSKAFLTPVNKSIEGTGTVSATHVKDTEMMKVSFTTNTAEKARKGNELLIKNFQEYVSSKEHSEVRYVVSDETKSQNSRGEPAAEAVVMERAEVEIIDSPTLPSMPTGAKNTKRILAVSVLLGILLGSGYAVMHALMNRKITTRQDVEDYLGLPVLAVVPEEKSLAEALACKNKESAWQKIGGLLWKEQN